MARGLDNAKSNKKDEFYTSYDDVEKEMVNYKDKFKNKVIYCNCDDPEWSNFTKYFINNFAFYRLKKLVCTHFEVDKPSYKLEYDGHKITKTPLKQNKMFEQLSLFDKDVQGFSGDFRSPECIEILKKSDIIITNPPFSLFRTYLAQLLEYKKQFIIMGSVNSVTYREIFPLFMENKVWLGQSIHSGDREFRVPDDYPLDAAGYRVDNAGNKYIRVKGVRWLTNIDYPALHGMLPMLSMKQNERNGVAYDQYDNYDAINVDKTKDIPFDYRKPMGVPITFLDKYNPDQFRILGLAKGSDTFHAKRTRIYENPIQHYKGKQKKDNNVNAAPAIRTTNIESDKYYTADNVSGYIRSLYARLLIENKMEYDEFGNLKGE